VFRKGGRLEDLVLPERSSEGEGYVESYKDETDPRNHDGDMYD
jgi:hypothetical protein